MTVQNKNDYINYDHESRLTRLEVITENINQTLVRLENKIDKIDSRLWQLLFFIFSLSGIILGVMAHGFKWL